MKKKTIYITILVLAALAVIINVTSCTPADSARQVVAEALQSITCM